MGPEITAEFVWSHIPKRPRESNKGSFGAVLAVAGSVCYRGAASLTVEGALRTGAGIVTLASVEPVLAAVSARLPECCLCPCEPGALPVILLIPGFTDMVFRTCSFHLQLRLVCLNLLSA